MKLACCSYMSLSYEWNRVWFAKAEESMDSNKKSDKRSKTELEITGED